jgi:hypothetical protein
MRASLDAFRPLFRSFFIRYAARFRVVSRPHEIVVTALFGCNIYTWTTSILFHRYREIFFAWRHGRSARVLTTRAKAGAFADEQNVDLEFRPLFAQLVIEDGNEGDTRVTL